MIAYNNVISALSFIYTAKLVVYTKLIADIPYIDNKILTQFFRKQKLLFDNPLIIPRVNSDYRVMINIDKKGVPNFLLIGYTLDFAFRFVRYLYKYYFI